MSDGDKLSQRVPIGPGVRAMNPHLFGPAVPQASKSDICAQPEPKGTEVKRKRRGKMNKTEARFADVLEAMRRRGDIASYRFEGTTLRWGNEEDFTFTPDFTVVVATCSGVDQEFRDGVHRTFVRLRFIEVKGAFIRERQWLQFKTARDAHPLYEFELWQWKAGNWTRLT